jgi:type II secretory pathway component GspD/PulD (secretin)
MHSHWSASAAAALNVVVCLVSAAAAQQSQATQTDPSVKPWVSPVSLSPDGRVTLQRGNWPLTATLSDLAAQTRIAIVVAESLAQETVAISFEQLTVEDALGRLLRPYDAFYLYPAEEKTAARRIVAVWVYARGEGRQMEPIPPAAAQASGELELRLAHPDVAVRFDAYEALIERAGADALPMIRRALADASEEVRLASLNAATTEGIEIPLTDLTAIVLTDPSRHVRLAALQALESRPDAAAVLTTLRTDPDHDIASQAAALLEHLQSAGKKRTPR